MKTLYTSSEVKENRSLSLSDPANYKLANTSLIFCIVCKDTMMEVFAKDADFTKFTCQECWETN